ncbi:MAG: SpoIIIAC/SpoIIIAD family protein [Oscillospiraceae bacterium]|nr:SpoIIIAC/SpoIIIAD family protein [Oscillospiraceae bacterium]
MMTFLGVGVVGMALAVLLRQYRPEYAPAVSLGTGVVIFLGVMSGLSPVFEELRLLMENAGLPVEYAEVLIKSLGICFLTQLAGDACRDAGETAIATKVELAGKAGVLAVSLPLFQSLLALVTTLVGG